jgi:hypothetical protein
MTRKLFLFCAFLFGAAICLLAMQDPAAVPKEIDTAIADAILATGIMGFSVTALTEMIKRLLHAAGFLSYAISAVVSAASTAFYLATGTGFEIGAFLIYTVLVFLIANGFYKFVRKPTS